MKNRGWLYTPLGLLGGVILGQWLAHHRKPNPAQPHRPTTAKPHSNRKLTREDVLRMIEENGGPKDLDLVGQDLSWIDLSREAISREVELATQQTGEPPIWQNVRNGGLNLRGANLARANLFGANLAYADLGYAILHGATLQASCLARAVLSRTEFHDADISSADLSGAFARRAVFENADLAATDLTDADIDECSLKEASLYKARLSGTRIGRRELGGAILQEDPEALSKFLIQHNPHYDPEVINKAVRKRQLEEARQVYASLKANFLETGNFEDASWAHIKERLMTKMTKAPWRARQYHGQTHPLGLTKLQMYESLPRWHPLTWWFWFKYTTKWLMDWITEVSCGYGEKPLRTLWWALAVVLILPIFYWLSGGIVSADGTPLTWLDYLNYSFGAFTTIGFARFMTANWIAETLTSLEALLGISVLALLMFALGNRISRS
jgi:hypothetical protein